MSWLRGDVDRERDQPGSGRRPRSRRSRRPRDRADRVEQVDRREPVSSAIGTKSSGEIAPALGMVPARQRLDRGDPPGGDVDDRLVVEGDLRRPRGRRRARRRSRRGSGSARAARRRRPRSGGLPTGSRSSAASASVDQRLGPAPPDRSATTTPDRDRRGQLLHAEVEGIVEGRQDRVAPSSTTSARCREPAAHHHELVAAGARDDVTGAGPRRQTGGRRRRGAGRRPRDRDRG